MANGVFNIAKGRAKELYNRVKSNDPAASVFRLLLFTGAGTDATLRDLDNVAAIEADAGFAEMTDGSYARKVLADTDLAALPAPDDGADDNSYTLPDTTWTALAGGESVTRLVVAYDATGADTDANMLVVTFHDFVVTPNGGDVTADFGADVFTAA